MQPLGYRHAAAETTAVPIRAPAGRAHDPTVNQRAALAGVHLPQAPRRVRADAGRNSVCARPAVETAEVATRAVSSVATAEVLRVAPMAVSHLPPTRSGERRLARHAAGHPLDSPALVTDRRAKQSRAPLAHERGALTAGRPGARRRKHRDRPRPAVSTSGAVVRLLCAYSAITPSSHRIGRLRQCRPAPRALTLRCVVPGARVGNYRGREVPGALATIASTTALYLAPLPSFGVLAARVFAAPRSARRGSDTSGSADRLPARPGGLPPHAPPTERERKCGAGRPLHPGPRLPTHRPPNGNGSAGQAGSSVR